MGVVSAPAKWNSFLPRHHRQSRQSRSRFQGRRAGSVGSWCHRRQNARSRSPAKKVKGSRGEGVKGSRHGRPSAKRGRRHIAEATTRSRACQQASKVQANHYVSYVHKADIAAGDHALKPPVNVLELGILSARSNVRLRTGAKPPISSHPLAPSPSRLPIVLVGEKDQGRPHADKQRPEHVHHRRSAEEGLRMARVVKGGCLRILPSTREDGSSGGWIMATLTRAYMVMSATRINAKNSGYSLSGR